MSAPTYSKASWLSSLRFYLSVRPDQMEITLTMQRLAYFNKYASLGLSLCGSVIKKNVNASR